MPKRTLDEAETMIARMSGELHHYKRSNGRWYMRTRMLEAAIKKHAQGKCSCAGKGGCLTRLVSLTPANDRPTLRQLRNRRMGAR